MAQVKLCYFPFTNIGLPPNQEMQEKSGEFVFNQRKPRKIFQKIKGNDGSLKFVLFYVSVMSITSSMDVTIAKFRIDLDVELSSHQLQKTGSNLFAVLVYQAVRLYFEFSSLQLRYL